MNLFDDEILTTKICKFGGPLVLFLCAPIYTWIMISVYKTDLAAGGSSHIGGSDVANGLILLAMLWFGVWMCRRGYGWFGGKKPD